MKLPHTTYAMFDRLLYMIASSSFSVKEIEIKFECSRSSVMRDIRYLRLFYDYDFVYNAATGRYDNNGSSICRIKGQ